ncbi:MAG: CHASE domain-containing protein [Nitrospiraceae bacterium]|nr:MAG: CHASE domain-containing protein [Nitrospiraceae bacterium]
MEAQPDDKPDNPSSMMKPVAQKMLRRRYIPVILLCCAGIVLSLLSWYFTSRAGQRQALAQFALDAQSRVNAIRRELDISIEVVTGLHRLFLSSQEVTREEFKNFARSVLAIHPDIQALEWLPRVSRTQREIYERTAHADGFPHFRFTDRAAQGTMAAAGEREEYYPVYYVEPYAGNEATLGFDLTSEPLHLDALNRARDSGSMSVSFPVTLEQETGSRGGFILFIPLYSRGVPLGSTQARQKHIAGFVTGIFRMGDIVENSYAYLPHRGVDLRITDESALPGRSLLYASPSLTGSSRSMNDAPGLQLRYSVRVGDRRWNIVATASPRYLSGQKDWLPWAVAAGVLLITGILAVYLGSSLRHTLRIEALMDDLGATVEEQKRTEKELHESQEQYEELIASIPSVTWISDWDGHTVFISPNVKRVYGYTQEEIYSKGEEVWFGRIHPDDSRLVKDAYRNLFQGEMPFNVEYRIRRKDNQWIWIHDTAIKTYRRDGYQLAYGVFSDITERKRMDTLLRQSEERYRLLFENSPMGIFHFTDRGEITECNEKLREIIGASREKTVQVNVLRDLTDKKMKEAVLEALSGRAGYYEGDYLSVAGEKRTPIKAHFAPLISGDGAVIGGIGVFEDITERRGLEAQLLQSQKMEAVGQLAGGIAHDFNNIITAIISYAYLVRKKMPDNDSLVSNMDRILSLSERASQITQGLLTFSRRQYYEFRPVTLNEVIRNMQHLLGQLIGEHITVRTGLSEGDTTIMADRTQIEQVILNLATNARDAMPGGGTLLIKTMIDGIDNGYVPAEGLRKAGEYVLLSVSDTGAGIRDDMKHKIFEPFFTTKEVGKGTGLGLAITYGIVRQHSGHIRVTDAPGGGTAFMIYLPRSDNPAIEEAPPEAPDLMGNMETVLLAEDEKLVRSSLKGILEESGYRVIEAVDGEDALEKFREHRDEIAVAILDIVMPKMNGRLASEEIRAARQDMNIIFISGYTSDYLNEGEVLNKNTAFIAKPVIPGTLLAEMKTLLRK